MSENSEWIRARGIGRERFAAYFADYLGELGYAVDRKEVEEPAGSVVSGELKRMNPAVPGGLKWIQVRFSPTSGGAAAFWERPLEAVPAERGSMDRFVRELVLHLERTVRTESHGTAKVQPAPGARLPWENGGTLAGNPGNGAAHDPPAGPRA